MFIAQWILEITDILMYKHFVPNPKNVPTALT